MTGNATTPSPFPVPSAGDLTHPDAWRMVIPLLVGAFMALLQVTVVNVALPSIEAGIGAGETQLTWVISSYSLAFGLVLIPAGRLGDLYGHRRIFIVGLALFSLTSLIAGLAQNPVQLIAVQTCQGFSAGLFYPAIVALFQILFRGADRGRIFAVFGAIIGISSAIGPLLGGALIQLGGADIGWRLIFLVNVPVGVVAVALAVRLLPGMDVQHDLGPRRSLVREIDPLGLVLLVAVGLTLLLPLVEGQSQGWPLWTWLSLAAAVVFAFVLWRWESAVERRGSTPLVAVSLLRHPAFLAGATLALIYFAAFVPVFFTLSILLQLGLSYSALAAGLIITPFAVGSLIGSANSHTVSARLGRNVLSLGMLLVTVGLGLTLLALWWRSPDPEPWLLTLPLFIAGVGNGLFIAPNTDFILAAVEPRRAGAASGLVNTAQRIGSAVGIAIISSTLFGTLRVGADGPAPAFLHSAELALLVNIGLAVLAFCLIFALPKQARGGREQAGASREQPRPVDQAASA